MNRLLIFPEIMTAATIPFALSLSTR